jgi:putative hemolysin
MTMTIARTLLLTAVVSVLPAGCALTVPLVGHDFAQYAGDSLAVKNTAYLIANEALYPPYQVQAGKPHDGEKEVCELPEGTPIEFRSFWRASRMRLMGAPVRSDYALVMVDSPVVGRVVAELPMSQLDGVFDGEKQHSRTAGND